MEINELVQQCAEDSAKWFPDWDRDLNYLAICLGGEVGEFQNVLKKVIRGSIPNDEEAFSSMANELVDALIYLCVIVGNMQFDLEEVYNAKRKFNDARFAGKGKSGLLQPNGDSSE